MLNCLNNSCSVLIMLFRNFYFLAISAMPCWCQMLNWLKQFLLSFVKYHTVFGDNLRKKPTEKITWKIKKSSSMEINAKIFNFITFIFNNITIAERVSNAKLSEQFLFSFVNAFSYFLFFSNIKNSELVSNAKLIETIPAQRRQISHLFWR